MRYADLRTRPTALSSRALALAASILAAATVASAPAPAWADRDPRGALRGVVESGGERQGGYRVHLYAAYVEGRPYTTFLGSDRTDRFGRFTIEYVPPRRLPPGSGPVLYLLAEKGEAMLASAIGPVSRHDRVVVNDLTTVATGFAFAQFVDGRKITGNTWGMRNAVHMAANLADPETGAVGEVLAGYPNGTTTSTLARFNALANIVAQCAVAASGCDTLFALATPDSTDPSPPETVLEAIANIAKDPSWNAAGLYDLSDDTAFYTPTPDEAPDAWTLVLRFGDTPDNKGPDNIMNGPGNITFDERGFIWVNTNYVPRQPFIPACAGRRLLKFFPWGKQVPGSPFFGGGLSGAGWGITLDPRGFVWVGNFGFEAPECENPNVPPFPDPANNIPARHNSVSKFRPDGRAVSPDPAGFNRGDISWPQATVSDKDGNIWTANCGNDSVTIIRRGHPHRAMNVDLQSPPGNPGVQEIRPFGMAIDLDGNAWVTGNLSETLTVVTRRGEVEILPAESEAGVKALYKPMGIAADSKGNMWIANSDTVDVPCPPPQPNGTIGPNASVGLYLADTRKPHPGSPFGLNGAGGTKIPWGISVDGDDTVWVANFGVTAPTSDPPPTDDLPRLSRYCGVDVEKCPARAQAVGAAISPANGYTSDALERNTTTAVDPSGNVWLANNWREVPPAVNPGGNSIAVYIGIAKPIQTPLIGPPVPFDSKRERRAGWRHW